MQKFLRENFVLALGIALPFVLMLAFIGLQASQKAMNDPPRYKAVFAVNPYYTNNGPFEAAVDDNGKLAVRFHAPKDTEPYARDRRPLTVYIYDPATGGTDTVTVESPTMIQDGATMSIPLPDRLGKLTLDKSRTAPDGYAFERRAYHNGNLFTELFTTRPSYSGEQFVLSKNGYRVVIPDTYEYGSEQFLGWVVP
jgi:hypothetical protein